MLDTYQNSRYACDLDSGGKQRANVQNIRTDIFTEAKMVNLEEYHKNRQCVHPCIKPPREVV